MAAFVLWSQQSRVQKVLNMCDTSAYVTASRKLTDILSFILFFLEKLSYSAMP